MWEIIPSIEKFEGVKGKRLGYTYLHGKLEEECGYDIYRIKNCDLPLHYPSSTYINDTEMKDGKYPCHYQGKDCTLYFWHSSDQRPHGLVVYNDDKESCKYAQENMDKKSFSI